jgi:hypothetical protein
MAIVYGGRIADTTLDGTTSAKAAISALDIKLINPAAPDGVYWINLPTVGPTQVFCLMNSQWDGGGWMLMLKATRGATFNYDSPHWTTMTTLNPTDLTRNDADAKYNVMNYFPAQSLMAIFPDVNIGSGGSIKGLGVHTWLQRNFNDGIRIAPTTFFATTTGSVGTPSGSGKFMGDARLFDGWEAGVFSSQWDIRFYGFNYTNVPNTYPVVAKARWGFGWNENGEGLFPGVTVGPAGSNDVSGGIGIMLTSEASKLSAGDFIACCTDTVGLNRSMRVEVYCR